MYIYICCDRRQWKGQQAQAKQPFRALRDCTGLLELELRQPVGGLSWAFSGRPIRSVWNCGTVPMEIKHLSGVAAELG